MERVYNFAAGPAAMPLPVLEKARDEMLCCGTSGMSVMEMSHRSAMYQEIFDKAVADLRDLMDIPESYEVLFMQGGATLEFSAIPLNLMAHGKADYIDSGNFAHLAAEEAARYGDVHIVASSRESGYHEIPDFHHASFDPEADYVYITQNNTIYGTRYAELPTVSVPLVSDASSMILSEKMDVARYGVIYAGAQKNIGPSGLCILIIRKDLLGHPLPACPKLMNWTLGVQSGSMLNTPNTWGIYIAGLTFRWLKEMGGVPAMEEINIQKSALLYDFLDQSRVFHPRALPGSRSRMNVTFDTGDKDLDAAFVKDAAAHGFVNLKGHRVTGGMRASIYNAMPMEGVQKLVAFMKEFEMRH